MTKIMKYFGVCVSVFCLLMGIGKADWYVSLDGSDSSEGTTWETAFATISTGIAKASEGETVWISNGTQEDGIYEISTALSITKNIALCGKEGEEVIIDAQNSGISCLSLSSSVRSAVISNLTFTGGTGNGAGIQMYGGTIVDCVFSNNNGANGGGVLHYYHPAVFSNCLFVGNTASTASGTGGGGLALITATNVVVVNCQFIGNITASGGGGAVAAGSDIKFISCAFTHNTAEKSGGGISTTASNALLYNCTIVSNESAENGGGVLIRAGIMDNCYVADNTATGAGGGGVRLSASNNAIIRNSEIVRNKTTGYGGGIYVYNDGFSPLIENCKISENVSGSYGGGISSVRPASAETIRNCLITYNISSNNYAGLYIHGLGTVVNCTIIGNQAGTGSGAGLCATKTSTNYNNIIYYNSPGDWHLTRKDVVFSNNCVPTAPDASYTRSGNNITDEPEFLDIDTGDYRLAAASPCINQGLDLEGLEGELDLDGRPRLDRFSGLVDIGCYEYIPQGVMFKLR